MFYAGIIGTEGAKNYDFFKKRCIYFLKPKAKDGITLVATEEHEYILRFAAECSLNIKYIFTNWKTYGKNALKERNKEFVSNCSGVIYFNDGLKDTLMIKTLAKKTGLPVKNASKTPNL
jgi:hypothetical protein